MSVTIATIAKAIDAPSAAAAWSEYLTRWSDLYRCKAIVKTMTLYGTTFSRKVRSMSMAKKVSEDWAALTWTENAKVTADQGPADEFLQSTLTEQFPTLFSAHLEKMYAKGTVALELLVDGMTIGENGNVTPDATATLDIDYIEAERIIPLKWNKGRVTECAFVSFPAKGRIDVREHHDIPGGIQITNRSFSEKAGRLTEIPEDRLIEEGVAPYIEILTPHRFFAVIVPGIVNNIDTTSPFGIPVYANAEDAMALVDLAFDNMAEDFELGGKIVFVPDTMLRRDEAGNLIPPQRDKRNLFVPLEAEVGIGGGAAEIHEYNPALRVVENAAGIQTALSLLSNACGFGAEHYVYRGETVATATQIVSENSDMFRNRRKHLLGISAAIVEFAQAILWAGANLVGLSIDAEAEVVVTTDDSVIEDDGARITRGMSLFQAGAISQRTFLVDYMQMSETDADAEVARSAVRMPELF